MSAFDVAGWRAQHRTTYSRWYWGWGHFAFTTVACLGIIALAISRVHAVRAAEWLTIPVSFLIANAAEYFGHRGPMHQPAKGLGLVYLRHALEHHRFFTHDAMAYESSRDFRMVLFPPVMLLFFLGGIATPIAALCFLLLSPTVGWLFVATAMSYFLSYEWLHFCYHLPHDSRVARLPFLPALRAHHTAHHNQELMAKWNFNITFPLCDAVMGTRWTGEPASSAATSTNLTA